MWTLTGSIRSIRLPKTKTGSGATAAYNAKRHISYGSFYCVYRTIDGHPACTYSRDGGHTWRTPQYKDPDVRIRRLRLYDTALRTSEAVGNCRAIQANDPAKQQDDTPS